MQLKLTSPKTRNLVYVIFFIVVILAIIIVYAYRKSEEICTPANIHYEKVIEDNGSWWKFILEYILPVGLLGTVENASVKAKEDICQGSYFRIFFVILRDHFLFDLMHVIKEIQIVLCATLFCCTDVVTGISGCIILVAVSFIFLMLVGCRSWRMRHHRNNTPETPCSFDHFQVAQNGSDICVECLKSTMFMVEHQRRKGGASSFIIRWSFVLLVSAIAVSIPWEFIRLYQKAVAERASKILIGTPAECSPQTMTLFESFKFFLRFHFSWSHGQDSCLDYHYALLVDPLWEVTPLMVITSTVTRCLLHPLELAGSSFGRSIRSFFSEIPVQWQLVTILLVAATSLIFLLMLCQYQLSIPLLLRIEPKSPVHDSSQNPMLEPEYDETLVSQANSASATQNKPLVNTTKDTRRRKTMTQSKKVKV